MDERERAARSAWLITGLLVLAWALADAVLAVSIKEYQRPWPAMPSVLALGAMFAQASLLGNWLVLGVWNPGLRIGVSAAAVSGLAFLAAVSLPETWSGGLAALLTSLACASGLALILRGRGLVLRMEAGARQDVPLRPARQFSIWALMSLMTGLAVLLATLRFARVPWPAWVPVVLLLGGIAANALVSFYLAFRWANRIFRWLATGVAAGLIGALLPFARAGGHDRTLLILMSLIQAAAVSGSVSVLRVAGWSLQRLPPANPADTQA